MKYVAVIGCGARVVQLMDLIADIPGIRIKGGYDPVQKHVDRLPGSSGKPMRYSNYREIVADEEVDWVIVGSPNAWHKEHIIAAFDRGKHVFAEKPLATTVEDCLNIYQKSLENDVLFATGFTLRYSTIYRRAKELIKKGVIGRIVAIDANENISPSHGAYIMRNWRRHKELSGPHILEKCVHDLDLLNWFIDSVPTRVAAFGGNNVFCPENASLYDELSQEFDNWEGVTLENPFLTEKSIEDNVVALMEYPSGVRVQFMATMGNAIPERRMYISGTKGTIVLELYSGRLEWRVLGQGEKPKVEIYAGGGHGDGDRFLTRSLADSILKGEKPICSGREGLQSAVVALAIDEARKTETIVDLREWLNFPELNNGNHYAEKT